jgi:DNA-binding SARP family transcriptional activator
VSIRIYLAGSVAIESGDILIRQADLPGAQGRVALTVLAAEHRRPVPRDELADELWGDSPPASHDVALRSVVSKLRSVLARAGLVDGSLAAAFGAYQLHLPEGSWVDLEAAPNAIHRAETAIRADDVSHATGWAVAANEIARRPLLPGAQGPWVARRRETLRGIRLRALDCLAEIWIAAGEPRVAIRDAEEALALDDLRESAWRQLMRAHEAAGDRASALRGYERCRARIAEELGASPSPETEATYLEILRSG